MIQIAIGIGIILNILSYEVIGYTAGGVVVPGYLALFFDQPWRIASTFLAAVLTLWTVQWLSRVVILYGRRQFAAMVLIGFFIHWLVDVLSATFTTALPSSHIDLRVVGHIVPGLIANEMRSQGIVPTVAVGMLAALVVRFALIVIQMGLGEGVGP